MRAIAGLKWGSHPSTLLSVYKGWIRSMLDYGWIAFVDVYRDAARILDGIQFRILRIVLSLFVTTPTNVILHLTGEMPLHIRRRFLTDRKVVKLLDAPREVSILFRILDRSDNSRFVSTLSLESYFLGSLFSMRDSYLDLLSENGSLSISDLSYFSSFGELCVDVHSGLRVPRGRGWPERGGTCWPWCYPGQDLVWGGSLGCGGFFYGWLLCLRRACWLWRLLLGEGN